MKRKIGDTAIVVNRDPDKFFEKLNEHIQLLQTKGYEVDVRFSTSSNLYSALILGYSEGG